MLAEKGIMQYFTASHSLTKASIAERSIGLVKRRLAKLRQHVQKPRRPRNRWVDLLDLCVQAHNRSPSSALKGYSPVFASHPDNFETMKAIQASKTPIRSIPYDYIRHGTPVRIRLKPSSFGLRADQPKSSEEIFRIRRVFSGYLSAQFFKIHMNSFRYPRNVPSRGRSKEHH